MYAALANLPRKLITVLFRYIQLIDRYNYRTLSVFEICLLQRPVITGPVSGKYTWYCHEYYRITLVIPRRIGSFERVAIRYHLDCCIRLYHDTNVETNPE
jgi:hypothetical protein